MTAVTAVTAQNTLGVLDVHEVPATVVERQIRAVLDDIGVDAVKTGVMWSAAIVDVVAGCFAGTAVPLVVDPVMRASTGNHLISDAGWDALQRRLLPLATVVTPNFAEAERLARRHGDRRELAEAIAALGPAAVLITGGHGQNADHLYAGGRHIEIRIDRVRAAADHGSGCTHSATVTAELAKGQPLEAAARIAARVTSRSIASGLAGIGHGTGPVDVLGLSQRG
jgi:hydroxymethylpyrimidine/phosphomethylpyrimidine kinase